MGPCLKVPSGISGWNLPAWNMWGRKKWKLSGGLQLSATKKSRLEWIGVCKFYRRWRSGSFSVNSVNTNDIACPQLDSWRLIPKGIPRSNHFAKKLTLPGCSGWYDLAFLYENAFSRMPKKLTKSTVKICDMSLVQNSTKHTQCASEVSG